MCQVSSELVPAVLPLAVDKILPFKKLEGPIFYLKRHLRNDHRQFLYSSLSRPIEKDVFANAAMRVFDNFL